VVLAVPTIHQLLLARVKKDSPRTGGRREGCASSARAAHRCRRRSCTTSKPAFGAPVLEAYGMTEAAHQMASNPLPPAARIPGSVGRGTDVQISIMDTAGRHLPTGERGEVVIKGPNVVRGYENNPEANASSFVDGWFRTGDQGVLDENGYLTLTGRLKETDQSRRREDLSARDRRGAAHPSEGCRGRCLRGAARVLGRRGRGSGHIER
jgi:acyl-CoA synthetase (AMP-forming)/AMP-acid ligase II